MAKLSQGYEDSSQSRQSLANITQSLPHQSHPSRDEFLCLSRIPVPPKPFTQALLRKERPKEELRCLCHLAFYKHIVFPLPPFEIRGQQPTG